MIRRSSLLNWPALATMLALTVFATSLVRAFNGGNSKATAVALPIAPPPGASFTGDNTLLTTPPAAGVQTWNNVTWWTWTPGTTTTFGVRATSLVPGSPAWDNTLEVWSGAGGATLVTQNDDFYGLDAQVTFTAVSGVPYVIGLGGFHAGAKGTATIRFFEAPAAPTSASATAGNASAMVTWSMANANEQSVTAYQVSRYIGGVQDGSAVTVSGSPPLTSRNMTGLVNGTAYTFRVAAVNSVGVSALSSPSSAATPTGVPGAPTAVSGVAGDANATVSFTAPASNGGLPITSYTVTSSPGAQTATGAGGPLVVLGLTNGTAYTFTVRATNSAGAGAPSAASAPVTPITVPGAPTAVSAVAGDANATVSFAAPASNGGAAITSYTVTSSPGGQTATGAGSPLVVASLTNGTAYTFTVRATNSAGAGAPSAASAPVTAAGVPAAPTAVSPVAGDANATVTFAAPASNGGAAITSYTVTASPGGQTATGAGSPLVVASLTNGTAYTFTVRAMNSVGAGAPSVASSPVTPTAPIAPPAAPVAPVTVPGPPTAASPVAGDANATVSFAAPASDGGAAITSYTVTSSPGGQSATGAGSPLVVASLANGTAYTFTVRATNSAGAGAPSAASPPATPFAPCSIALSLTDLVLPSIGAGGTVSLTTSAGCAWTATPTAPWVVIAPATGIGSTLLTYVVHENNGEGSRTATVSLASAGSATLGVAQQGRAVVPGAPVDLRVSVGGNAARLDWNPVGSGGGATDHVLEVGSAPGLTDLGQIRTGTARQFYEARELPPGTYYVRVRAVNAQGASDPSNEAVIITPGQEGGLPGSPGVLLPLAAEGTRLGVRWSAPGEGLVTGYLVEFGTAPGASNAARIDVPATDTSFSWDSVAVPEGSYYVRVRGVNGQGQGPPSHEIAMTFGQRTGQVPGRPTGLAARVADGQLTMTWNAPPGGGAATGYFVEVSTVPGAVNLYQAAVGSSPTSWSFPVVPSGAYYLRVRGLNAFGLGSASEEIAVGLDVPAGALPGTPRALSARVEGQRLTLFWTAPAEGGSVAQYLVDVGSASALTDLASLSTGTALTEWSYEGVPEGLTFFLRVRAQNPVGMGQQSNEVRIGSADGRTAIVPGVPTNLIATETESTVSVAWDPAASGDDPVSYVLTILSADNQPLHVVELLTRVVTANLRDIPPGTYHVDVRAKGADGQMSDATPSLVVVVPQP